MGVIRETATGQTRILESDHVVGRVAAPMCSLTVSQPFVSGVHAELRWTGQTWELKDLGSRNGTYLDGKRVDSSLPYVIEKGSRIGFGRIDQEWQLVDDSPPPVMAVPLDGGDPVTIAGDLIPLPSGDDPRATIYRGVDGGWLLETPDEVAVPIVHMQTFEAAGRVWRFCCSPMAPATVASPGVSMSAVEVRSLQLAFSVSRDEEHVQLRVFRGDRAHDLGARRHNFLLLTLARQRLADAAEGLQDTSCGWVDQDDLAHDPTMAPPQLNVDVFRIREQFAKLGVIDAASIVERRPQPRQLRIGTGLLVITTV
jgi:FHA domain